MTITLLLIECPSGYQDLVPGSGYCYRISSSNHQWDTSKRECEEDGAMLACFGTKYERDQLAKACDNCWVGYTWKEGMIKDIFGLRSFILFIIICERNYRNRSTYIYIYQIRGSRWRLL